VTWGQVAGNAAPGAPPGILAPAPSVAVPGFVGLGVSLLPQSSPKPVPEFIWASPATSGGKVWTVTVANVTFAGKSVQTTLWGGLCTPLTTPWNTTVFQCVGLGPTVLASAVPTSLGVSIGYQLNEATLIQAKVGKSRLFIGPFVGHGSVGGNQAAIEMVWGFSTK
jgi:hypothetical protein